MKQIIRNGSLWSHYHKLFEISLTLQKMYVQKKQNKSAIFCLQLFYDLDISDLRGTRPPTHADGSIISFYFWL